MTQDTVNRRGALAGMSLASLAAMAGAARAQTGDQERTDAPQAGETDAIRVIHIMATADGGSAVEILTVNGASKPLPVRSVSANSYRPSAVEWHTAPGKVFSINMAGNIQGETTDSPLVDIGPGDLVYMDDLTGQGHVTHLLTPVANLFLFMPDDFDIYEWAGQPA